MKPKNREIVYFLVMLCCSLTANTAMNFLAGRYRDPNNLVLATEIEPNIGDRFLHQLVESYLNKTTVETAPNLTLEEAKQIQDRFVEAMGKKLGPPIGYKAGLTSENAQKQFNVSQPLLGRLLEQMLLPNGTVISAKFGSRPFSEGDLIVRVGSEEINNAKTSQEALASLDAVIPFIELPDLVYSREVKLDTPALVAINVGARYGVLGKAIPLQPTEEWENRLKNVTLEIWDENSKVLASGKGSNLLGNPLNVVLWIKDTLQAEGKQLKPGDLLSLGTITPLMPVKANTSIRARYTGLKPNETVEVSVEFAE